MTATVTEATPLIAEATKKNVIHGCLCGQLPFAKTCSLPYVVVLDNRMVWMTPTGQANTFAATPTAGELVGCQVALPFAARAAL